MIDYCSLKNSLKAKLLELTQRAEGVERSLSDPGDKDWEENAIAKENDETLDAIGRATDNEINDITLALNRIDSGEYGICTGCNKPIPPARLEVIPWASTCVRCATMRLSDTHDEQFEDSQK